MRPATLIRLVAAAFIIAGWWHWLRPSSVTAQLNAIGRVEARSWYVVPLDNGDSITIAATTAQTTDAVGNSSRPDSADITGCYISADGDFITTTAALHQALPTLSTDSLVTLLTDEQERLTALSQRKAAAQRELDYYARTHSVTDDGYNDIMDQRDINAQQTANVDTLLQRITQALQQKHLTAELHTDITVSSAIGERRSYATDSLPQLRTYRRHMTIAGRSGNLLLLRPTDRQLPPTAHYFSIAPTLHVGDGGQRWLAYSPGQPWADAINVDENFTPLAGTYEGAAITDSRGHLKGMRCGDSMATLSDIRHLCFSATKQWRHWLDNCRRNLIVSLTPTTDTVKAQPAPAETFARNTLSYNNCGNAYGNLATDAKERYCGHLVDEKPEGYGTMVYNDSTTYSGTWHQGRRHGWGILANSEGNATRWSGIWNNDTLHAGTMVDSEGTYVGDFDDTLERTGYGTLTDSDGNIYCGQWQSGHREGFGYDIGKSSIVRAGSWKNDAFRGESFIYTADRVYGIDISRYQHEIGRKRYAIDWSKLRIKSLGASNAGRIRGTQDYPVSFVYIKATQGTTVTNKYYAADATACRRHGIAVGAYHFFSTTTGGQAQARHFVRTAARRSSDLPPVLDVEPSDSEVRAMGGSATMFNEITAWLRYVRNACGVRPILYISQSFVNKYMADAPEEVTACQVWIARYSEYKPYVHLLHWQHSDNGRVEGIHGAVDINVFNGNRAQFQTYLKEVRGE